MNEIMVSVVVPVYRIEESWLRSCIESAAGQTLKDLEIILVDDGSPDNCGAVCDSYAAADGRIRVIHQENKGLCGARNSGVRAAAGRYVTFVDGDDRMKPDMLEKLVQKAEETGADIVVCGIVRDYGDHEEEFPFAWDEAAVYDGKALQKELLTFESRISDAFAKLIRRSLMTENNIYHDEKLRQGAESMEFNLRLFEHAEKVVFLGEYGYLYRYNPYSISSFCSKQNTEYSLGCFRKIREYVETLPQGGELVLQLDNRLLYFVVTTAVSGFFHPDYPGSLRQRSAEYLAFSRDPLIAEALESGRTEGLSGQRKLILKLLDLHIFFAVDCLGRIRYRQKKG